MSGVFHKICAEDDIAENGDRAVTLEGTDILICRTHEGVFAVENKCTHQLQKLEGGKIRGCFIFCPLHGQRFNLKDGSPIGKLTDVPLKTFPVKCEEGAVWVSLEPRGGQD